ncbi:LEAF RUST 10 DISEASE-RESISTANCE LOCUS RECEPTOR-LIKE PROTEIN KINASE-like 2.1 [Durio zibethinus]|uniref:non-specific serine/threonine protein kinase n=1 Tax=Durio zibethinus TaxID=66656 RepID=A0A6P5WMU2_DURZI|nr:LEAF RUST 10 DISEASE-RESISTANCE LOCUS RECEPTOR-LIKE PROTEIN KINASE-like 2.1 [Durio zibethinus]
MSFKLSFLLLMNVYIVILFFAVRKSLAICNVTRNCGKLNIEFPFFIQEQQEARCGYPGFNISCRNNTNPIFSMPDGDYIIHDIFYHNQSFRVSKVTPDVDEICSQSIRNISIPGDWLYLPQGQGEMVLLSNCNSTLQTNLTWDLGQFKVICPAEYRTKITLEMFSDNPMLDYASKYCNKSVVVPVAFYDGTDPGINDARGRGFVLNWIASDCSICEANGGKCGIDNSTRRFKCFCPDRPHCTPRPGNDSTGFVIKVATASSVAGAVVVIILVCLIKILSSKDGREGDKKIEAFLKGHEFHTPKRYRYSDIKTMTNSFRDKLGKGGYGDVYRGKLPDGRQVAVKILNKSKGNGEEFMNEVASISRTSHVNVVTLLGFCFEGRRRALIYEFMKNGSLDKFIFQEKEQRQLKWETLYQIAVGIARGLEYLHRGCNTRILHFDIKPHNILLDDEFRPKISDFGLARLCPEKESAISMTGARGTAGYIAPEVYSRNFGRVSHKSDAYSYGMMILEMVGGRQNINVEVDHTSEIYFPHWIYSRIELDEDLELQGIIDEADRERVRKMIIVSLWCIQTDPSNRPPMSRVVEMMEGNIDSLSIPPKPFSSSPPRSPSANPEVQPVS